MTLETRRVMGSGMRSMPFADLRRDRRVIEERDERHAADHVARQRRQQEAGEVVGQRRVAGEHRIRDSS